MNACQCEHASHFKDTGRLTPAGKHGHEYGSSFSDEFIVMVSTSAGLFQVCQDCANDCYYFFSSAVSKPLMRGHSGQN